MNKLCTTAGLCITLTQALPQNDRLDLHSHDAIPAPAHPHAATHTANLHQTFSSSKLLPNQAHANYVYMEGDDVMDALDEMQDSTSFDDLADEYDWKNVEKDMVVTRQFYKDPQNRDVTEYISAGQNGKPGHTIMVFDPNAAIASTGKWVVDFRPRTSGAKASLSAFYFTDDFTPGKSPAGSSQSSGSSSTSSTETTQSQQSQSAKAEVDSSSQQFYDKIVTVNSQIDQTRASQQWMGVNAKSAQTLTTKRKRWLTFITVCRSVPLMQIVLALLVK